MRKNELDEVNGKTTESEDDEAVRAAASVFH